MTLTTFTAHPRYEVRRRIGGGGHGVVFEAFDTHERRVVALKTLASLDPAGIYTLKREFRALCDVSHPNLVQLHDLHAEGEHCFFTMELVDGVPFGVRAARVHDDGGAVTLPVDAPPPSTAPLRELLRQLAEGVAYLHDVGIVHRDLKPSNVLVTGEGRVVILDFGIVERLQGNAAANTGAHGIVGTPAFMAPEQAADGAVGPPADWYAFGVILFQALTGKLPYEGTSTAILAAKLSHDPPAPSAIVRDVPPDLDALCVALLRRDPAARPSGAEILARLGVGRVHLSTAREAPFVGRAAELAALRRAYARTREGQLATVVVRGASGVGKTALVRRFLEEVDDDRPAPLILAGRCFEREAVPYKAFDGAIDALSRALLRWSNEEVASVLPRDAAALSRLFPVLERVPAIADAPRRTVADPQQLRLRAFAALREMLSRIGDRRPVVLFIDDVQWHDADSVALAADLTAPPDPPALLLILGHRSDGDAASPTALESRLGAVTVVELPALTPEDARSLARALLRDDDEAIAARVAEESAGSPFFVGELARAVPTLGANVRLADVIEERIAELPRDVRALLEVVAVAQAPIPVEAAVRASGVDLGEATRTAAMLRARQFLRSTPRGAREALEPYHDRIRVAVLARLDDDARRELHARIGTALASVGEDDPEVLFRHFHAAGRDDRALPYARAAAERAMRALAFDRAAELHRAALDAIDDPDAARLTRIALADALAHAGRGREAAEVYAAAAETSDAAEALRLRVRSAEQLLISGYVDRGVAAVEKVLEGVGMRLARTPRRALVGLVLLRLWLWVRGLSFRAVDASTVSPHDLMRIDVCRSVGFGLAPVDNLRAAEFQSRHLALCLAVGEPHRVSRALAIEATMRATEGRAGLARSARLTAAAERLARELGTPEAEAALLIARSAMAYFTGNFRSTRIDSERAIEILRERVTGMRWELDGLQFFQMCTLAYLGDLRGLAQQLPPLVREAEERGDLYLATNLAVGDTNLHFLVQDRPSDAREAIRAGIARWSRQSFHIQHAYAACSEALVDLYEDDPRAALARMPAVFAGMRRSLQSRIQFSRVRARFVEGRAALACGELDRARRAARALLRERVPWATAFGEMLLARVERGRAIEHLQRAIVAAEACGLSLHIAVARDRLGELISGEEGARLRAEAAAYFEREGVVAPERLKRAYLP